MTESTAHLGRSQVLSPNHHCRKETMLTERKREGCPEWGYEREEEMRESVSRDRLGVSLQPSSIIHEFLADMLADEKHNQMEQFSELLG